MLKAARAVLFHDGTILPFHPPGSLSAAVTSSPASAATAAVVARLREWPGEHRVAVGLSGGVDSSLTAALLVAAGWQVEGLTLWLMSGKGACCAEGLVDAAGICEQLGVPHHVVDSRERFREQIVDFLVDGYGDGVTPLPCSRCNREVKFGPMLRWAETERGIGRVATGHYARVRLAGSGEDRSLPGEADGRQQLLRGLDAHKDQSYFLYDLSQAVLGSSRLSPGGAHQGSDARRGLPPGPAHCREAGKPGPLPGRSPWVDAGVPGRLPAAAPGGDHPGGRHGAGPS